MVTMVLTTILYDAVALSTNSFTTRFSLQDDYTAKLQRILFMLTKRKSLQSKHKLYLCFLQSFTVFLRATGLAMYYAQAQTIPKALVKRQYIMYTFNFFRSSNFGGHPQIKGVQFPECYIHLFDGVNISLMWSEGTYPGSCQVVTLRKNLVALEEENLLICRQAKRFA